MTRKELEKELDWVINCINGLKRMIDDIPDKTEIQNLIIDICQRLIWITKQLR